MSQVFQKKFKKYTKNNLNFFKEKKYMENSFVSQAFSTKNILKINF